MKVHWYAYIIINYTYCIMCKFYSSLYLNRKTAVDSDAIWGFQRAKNEGCKAEITLTSFNIGIAVLLIHYFPFTKYMGFCY